ncbi:MAG TPA: prepilin-type N-terminal cleavage/methylation domain-containing protein [bacterium (Candidatus Stahlbacteria)]|nr:prepilin-type N-terminal cleavage/methylation domain-containing protein [Candidatus Stahlbacteria bacterium]
MKGLTLIELMVALIIIAVALMALAQTRVTSDAMAFGASQSRNATAIAQDLFEDLRNMPFNQLIPGTYQDQIGNVTRTWTITQEGNPPDPLLLRVNLTIQWQEPGRVKQAQFTTHITRR